MMRALRGVFGRRSPAAARRSTIWRALAVAGAAAAIAASPASAAQGKRRHAKMAPAFSGALFRAPNTDGLAAPRRVVSRFAGAVDDLEDPFFDGAATGRGGLEFAPGWKAEATVYGSGRSDRSRAPLDTPTDGFSSRLTRSFGQGASLSSTVETDPAILTTTLEAKQEFRGTIARGKALVSAVELGWARERKVGHGLYASFAQGGVALTRRGSADPTRDAVWINSKTSVEIAPRLSLTAEFEAETNSDGHMLLGYFGFKQNW